MAYLTYLGANAGSPTENTIAPPAAVESAGQRRSRSSTPARSVVAQSGCEACHMIGDNGNTGPGPNLTHIGSRLPAQAIARTLVNPTSADALVREARRSAAQAVHGRSSPSSSDLK